VKICIINNLYGAEAKGGAERVVQLEAEALAARGHEVLVVSSAKADRTGRDAATNVRHVALALPNLYFYGDGFMHGWPTRLLWHAVDAFAAGGPRRVLAALGEFKPDVVHTHNLMGIGFRLPRLLKAAGYAHVHTVHDVQLVNPSGLIPAGGSGMPARVMERAHAAVLRLVFGSPRAAVYPSRFMADFYAAHGLFDRAETVVLPNPAPAASNVARERTDAPPRFLFVGQLEPHKGVRLLLEAWRTASLSGATLIMAGDGSLRPAVETAAADDRTIDYRGRLGGAELAEAYRETSFVVVPSLVIENSPTVILEAFAAGTPVIAVAAGGVPELVHDGQEGLLVGFAGASGSAAPVRLALVQALRMAAAIRVGDWWGFSEAARAAVADRGLQRHTDRLLAIYQNVLDS
jgi:glycosyltransferase involved in cell wall biosynthesis